MRRTTTLFLQIRWVLTSNSAARVCPPSQPSNIHPNLVLLHPGDESLRVKRIFSPNPAIMELVRNLRTSESYIINGASPV
ncbi:hypothetical protein AMECASPLE_015712 [Ameca splendens]|uniref:Secreted protein n=1 Tax=Ameca splendens TaxID=208324 RepID=A0ABV1A9E8_9TELE